MFKKEISIDHGEESIEKGKHLKSLGSVKPPIKNKNNFNNSAKKYNNLISLNKNRNRNKIIFVNKNIIINDITKNYDANTNKTQHKKKKISIIKTISNHINSINDSKNKYKSINTESNIHNNNNNRITRGTQKLNLENKNDIRKITNVNKASLRHRQSKPMLKSSFNEKEVQCIEKKKNVDNLNKKKKFSFGDSYEFNFTFNNYNNNFTYNNANEVLKEDKKKTNKIVIENLSKENIINKFKSIKPSSVRNNILGELKNILSKNIDKKISNPKFKEKNQKLNENNLKDKNNYAIKIQKLFRGYNFRKNNKLNDKNKRNASNSQIYIRKKALSGRRWLNSNNISNTENNLISKTYFKEGSQNIFKDTKNENESENKIQEIIIDKNKILNVLNPSSQRNKIKEIQINNNYSFRNNIRNKKYKLLKFFNYWKNITSKKLIVQRLIEYSGSKRNYTREINLNTNIQPQNGKNNEIRYYKRTIFKNNYFI